MPRYKPQERNGLLLPVVLSEQILPGSFAFALDYLVDHELDFTAMDIGFKNDETGASAYDPRVMLKIVLLAYSQGLISSRSIEQACLRNVQFIAISGHSQPSHTHIAKFVCNLRDQIQPLFRQVLMTCDAQGLIGRDERFRNQDKYKSKPDPLWSKTSIGKAGDSTAGGLEP
jgi:transposase